MRSWLVVVFGCLVAAFASSAPVPPDPSEAPLWHTAAIGRGMPAVLGTRAYGLTTDHHVVALNLADGHELWRRSTGESGWLTEGSRAVIASDAVVVGDWDVYAYDAESGAARWSFHPSSGFGPGVFLGQAAGGRLFTGSPSGSIFALDVASGRQAWNAVVNGDGRTTVFEPATDGAIVVATYTVFTAPNTGGVVAVDAETGHERWRFVFPRPSDAALGSYAGGGPVFANDLAIAASGDGTIWALDRRTGVVRWSLPRLAGPIHGIITATDRDLRSLAVVRGRLIVGSLTGYVVAYDLATQREVWRLENGFLGSIAFDDFTSGEGVVYVPYVSGFLLAIDALGGAVLWQTRNFQQGFSWPPAVAGDRVIAAGRSGFWAFPAGVPHGPGQP
ncbi:MAG: PQQ-binding-like beta-propeller repeat protein [Acidobacteriota bacterium]